jgi:hypothetical protein
MDSSNDATIDCKFLLTRSSVVIRRLFTIFDSDAFTVPYGVGQKPSNPTRKSAADRAVTFSDVPRQAIARPTTVEYYARVSQITITLPDPLDAEVERRARAAGFNSTQDYLLELVRVHCEESSLESVLETRMEGPFEPLEADWKARVRDGAKHRGQSNS